MGSVSMETIFKSIDGYSKTLEQFGFKPAGTGARTWSHRYVNGQGLAMEFNAQGWDLIRNAVTVSGFNCTDFRKVMLSECTREQLIQLLTD